VPDRAAQLAQAGNGTFSPAKLLTFERQQLGRQFSRGDNVGPVHGMPTGQLGSIAQIQILAQRIILPSAALLNAGPPPDASRSVEVDETAGL